jgi:hypothetical protein
MPAYCRLFARSAVSAGSGGGRFATALNRPAWHARAACRGKGPIPYFPGRGCNTQAPTRAVLRVCRRLPARAGGRG